MTNRKDASILNQMKLRFFTNTQIYKNLSTNVAYILLRYDEKVLKCSYKLCKGEKMSTLEADKERAILIGKRIRLIRDLRGMRQADLAEKADLSVSSIGEIERGKDNTTLHTLKRIAEALNVSLSYLLADEAGDELEQNEEWVRNNELMREFNEYFRDQNIPLQNNIIQAILYMRKALDEAKNTLPDDLGTHL